jgi:EAL domain-containing protein (putative c-di-GMP-specific phosphodiesterase class I)/ActR/RegA family two-component response regulator
MAVDAHSTVLLVDDEPLILRAYSAMLASKQHEVITARSGVEALELLRRHPFDVIVSDIAMPGLDGIELLGKVREQDLDVPVILMTGGPTVETATQAVERGAFRYLTKPVRLADLCGAVAQARSLHQLAVLKRQALELMGRTEHQLGDRAGLEVRMHVALENLVLHYQPIVSWSSRSIVAYEALLRSREPTLPNAPAILAAAERLGCVPELGRRVRREVAAAAGSLPDGVRIFANLHCAELLDDDLYDTAAPLSAKAGNVVLEITERATLESVPDARERVARLRAMGYGIAVDDLGAGYAGLSSLAQIEPDLVKLDMSLTRGIDASPTKQILVRSMASLSDEMGMRFVVEGVETEAELEALVALGVDVFQGFLFATPAPAFPAVRWPGGTAREEHADARPAARR